MKSKKEKPELKQRTSRKAYLPFYFMALALLLLLVFIRYKNLPISRLGLAIAIVFIVLTVKFTEMHRFNTYSAITTNYLVHSRGIFSRKVKKVAYPSISDINLRQSVWQRILNFGTIQVYQYSKGTLTEIKNINKPLRFLDILADKRGTLTG
jgi:uncharacterized membrane protein YdbT with pleckstrin-like domain